jgi:hypothetical protein
MGFLQNAFHSRLLHCRGRFTCSFVDAIILCRVPIPTGRGTLTAYPYLFVRTMRAQERIPSRAVLHRKNSGIERG